MVGGQELWADADCGCGVGGRWPQRSGGVMGQRVLHNRPPFGGRGQPRNGWAWGNRGGKPRLRLVGRRRAGFK